MLAQSRVTEIYSLPQGGRLDASGSRQGGTDAQASELVDEGIQPSFGRS